MTGLLTGVPSFDSGITRESIGVFRRWGESHRDRWYRPVAQRFEQTRHFLELPRVVRGDEKRALFSLQGTAAHGLSGANEAKELIPSVLVIPERAKHSRRDHLHARLRYAPCRHTLVRGFDHDTHPQGFEHLLNGIGDLGRQLFLDL